MAFPGMVGMPGGGAAAANAGMSEQEQKMVKMVRSHPPTCTHDDHPWPNISHSRYFQRLTNGLDTIWLGILRFQIHYGRWDGFRAGWRIRIVHG